MISVVSDVTPPPNSDLPPGLNPFTPEWFAKIIGAAASAAASAAVSSAMRPTPAVPSLTTPRRLNERKIPDFWEDRPEFWFQIFDAHLGHFNPSERQCFDTLLPLLTAAARAQVHAVIRTPGLQPYTKARQVLLRHFGRTPRQMAREMRDARSLGDKLPSEFLDHLRGLVPDFNVMFEVALLDALPANARDAALQHSNIDAMAEAADLVVLENRVAAASLHDPGVSSISSPNPVTEYYAELQQHQSSPDLAAHDASVAALSRGPRRPPFRRTDSLCAIHAKWGREAFKCSGPSFCKMKNVVRPRQAAATSPAPAAGNANAGGRQ